MTLIFYKFIVELCDVKIKLQAGSYSEYTLLKKRLTVFKVILFAVFIGT